MSIFKRANLLFVAIMPLFLTASTANNGYSQPAFTKAPLNPEFIGYMQKSEGMSAAEQTRTADGHGLGLIPVPLDFSHLKGISLPKDFFRAQDGYDSVYDMRTLGRLTPVRDQGSYGTCWAFATYASLESWLLTDEDATWNFSENNMANLHGYDWGYDEGGNFFMATAYLARWAGPVSEADDPYPAPGESTGSETVQKHVQEVLFLPLRGSSLDNDFIKEAVIQYGAVYVSMYAGSLSDPFSNYFNGTHNAYYYSGEESNNHGVAIVGWNDNFPASYFNSTPPGNGAFIVRNSWGEGFGEEGYFYVSYYDSVIGKVNSCTAFNNAESVSNYSAIYQYDPLGLFDVVGLGGNTSWFSNIFTASASHNITAASFYTMALDSSYEVYVYSGVTAGSPRSGVLASTTTGTIAMPGYHTVVLNTPVAVASGQSFSVVVKLTTPSYAYQIPLEYKWPGYTSGVTANAGESFISSDGTTWYDLDQQDLYYEDDVMSVCLKAFAGEAAEVPVLNVNPSSLNFGLETGSMTFSVTNAGSGTLNWSTGTIVYNEGSGWITSVSPGSGSVTTGTDTVTVSINRTGLASGLYSATIPVNSDGGSRDVTVSAREESPPDKPQNVSPGPDATGVSVTPVLTASPFSDPDGDALGLARWRIKKGTTAIWNSSNTSNFINVPAGLLDYGTTYGWQAEYVDSYGLPSGWSVETLFTTMEEPQTPPSQPVNQSPANLATGVPLTPTLSASSFSDPDGDTLSESQWRIRTETGVYETASVFTGEYTSVTVPSALETATMYVWQVRYVDSDGIPSLWSEETAFTTSGETDDGGDEDDGDEDEARGGDSGGGCFIATAAYGTPMAAEVVNLSRFRDRVLMKNMAGRAFVRWYYRHSPAVADYIRNKPAVKFAVRTGLRPLAWILGTLTK